MILPEDPLAFVSDTAPMDLTDREELSRALDDAPDASDALACMAVRAVGSGPVFRIADSGNEHDDFTKAEFQEPRPDFD